MAIAVVWCCLKTLRAECVRNLVTFGIRKPGFEHWRAMRHEVLNACHDCLDAHSLVLHTLNFTEDRWDYEFRHRIFDEFLIIPDALDLLKLGLEQLMSESFSSSDRRGVNGCYQLVAEQQGRDRCSTELAGRISIAHAA